jgi:transposase
MLKDVAFDQEDPTEAYKKIEKQITKIESDLQYYKRLAVAADKYIMVKARNEMIVDTGRQLTDEEHDQQYKAFTEYTSILQEREARK